MDFSADGGKDPELGVTDTTMEYVGIIDENDELVLCGYTRCDNTFADEVKVHRGIIKEKNTDRIIALSLPFTDEFTLSESTLEELKPDTEQPDEKHVFFNSIEGTMLRVYWYNNQWYVSTNRKIDAFQSYWSSRVSFGKLFLDQLQKMQKSQHSQQEVVGEVTSDISLQEQLSVLTTHLDKEFIYFFLLRPTIDNRIVCAVYMNDCGIYYTGRIAKADQDKPVREVKIDLDDESVTNLSHNSDQNGNKVIQKNHKLVFHTWSDVMKHVNNINIWQHQGVICFDRSSNHQWKLIHPLYKHYWEIRNNNPNLYLRYLEIRQDARKREDFFRLYPRFIDIAEKIEEKIFQLSKHLCDAYIERYIRKRFLSLPKQEFFVLKKAHEWHNADKEHNRIYRDKIYTLLNEQPSNSLYQMVKRFAAPAEPAPLVQPEVTTG